MRPVFGASLTDHLSNSKQEIATVLEVCCTALREHGMDTEGLFRIAAGSSKVKFLKVFLYLTNYVKPQSSAVACMLIGIAAKI